MRRAPRPAVALVVARLSATSWACIAAAVLSLVALRDLPYGYYMLLRWVVCGASIAVGVVLLGKERTAVALPFWGLAILYNPIFRIYLEREAWEVLNVVAAVALVLGAVAVRERAGGLSL